MKRVALVIVALAAGTAMDRICYLPYRCNIARRQLTARTLGLYQAPTTFRTVSASRETLRESSRLAEVCPCDIAVDLYMVAAANARRLGVPEQGVANYEKALHLDRRPEIYYDLGLSLIEAGRPADAVRPLVLAASFDAALRESLPPQVAEEVRRKLPGDQTPPSGRIDPLPAWTNRPIESVTGTAQDDPKGLGVRVNQIVVRAHPEAGCNSPARDWNGTSWVDPCLVVSGPARGTERWIYDRMPPAGELTSACTYGIYLTVIDFAGNQDSSHSAAFGYDPVPPKAVVERISAASISGSASDSGGSGVKSLTLSISCNGGSSDSGRSTDCVGSGAPHFWNGSRWVRGTPVEIPASCDGCPGNAVRWHVVAPPSTALVPGKEYMAEARVIDNAGNATNAKLQRPFR